MHLHFLLLFSLKHSDHLIHWNQQPQLGQLNLEFLERLKHLANLVILVHLEGQLHQLRLAHQRDLLLQQLHLFHLFQQDLLILEFLERLEHQRGQLNQLVLQHLGCLEHQLVRLCYRLKSKWLHLFCNIHFHRSCSGKNHPRHLMRQLVRSCHSAIDLIDSLNF